MDDYIKRSDALRAVGRQIGLQRSPEQNDMLSHIRYNLLKIPAADVAEVVRCKDCKYRRKNDENEPYCIAEDGLSDPWDDKFCSYGERK